jgi:hypothetical protein
MIYRRIQSIALGLSDYLLQTCDEGPKGHIFLDGAKCETHLQSAVVTQRRMRDFENSVKSVKKPGCWYKSYQTSLLLV